MISLVYDGVGRLFLLKILSGTILNSVTSWTLLNILWGNWDAGTMFVDTPISDKTDIFASASY